MFWHYHIILRQLVINTLSSYTSISNTAVGNTIYNQDVSHRFYASSHVIVVEISILQNLQNIKIVLFTCLKKTQLDAQLILSIYRQPVHVLGLSKPIIRMYICMYITIGTYYSF